MTKDDYRTIDVLIPTCDRPVALAVTLASLCAQTYRDFQVIISDQTEERDISEIKEVQAVMRVLEVHGHLVKTYKNLPRRGIAEQRQFLLDKATATYVIFLDDDIILEPYVLQNLLTAIQEEKCGFVGNAFIGLSFINDIRPHEQNIEFWDTPVTPEVVKSGTPAWERWRLHNAANLHHIQQRFNITSDRPRKYRIAWASGCAIYDRQKLLDIGGYNFWQELPPHACGEDVLVQLRLMAKYGGCGLLPSGAYHQELPTTISDRSVDAPHLLPIC
ncbi:glycosyltransferase family A protein [Chroococcidiopsis sp. CCNUC1]|nr:glycosyltransferase family A protein [Chroococcidiopsis sp. CCNUC1]PSB46964.1 glycosyl transferase [Cyanosarcina cf. burmensis CCALA 770]URD52602.1 glycosyltransferase family 2 protein [Chroococcidiopsis sp. CCNUC1]